MIIDRIDEAGRYAGLHPLFPRAFESLKRRDLAALPPGRHPIDGERLTLVINTEEGKGPAHAVLESHRRFIDIQFVIDGTDLIGWRPLRECLDVRQPYDASKDVAFYGEEPHMWSRVAGPLFAVYFPADAHAPLGGTGRLLKAILKVAI